MKPRLRGFFQRFFKNCLFYLLPIFQKQQKDDSIGQKKHERKDCGREEPDRADWVEVFDFPDKSHNQRPNATAENADQKRSDQAARLFARQDATDRQADDCRETDPNQNQIDPLLGRYGKIVVRHRSR